MTNIRLKRVSKEDYEFLFILLKERDSKTNISHRKMPNFQQHVKFVKSKPYSFWYIIMHNNEKAGSIYLTSMNEIGIFLKKGVLRKGIGKKAILKLMKKHPRSRFLANVSPMNIKSQKFFKNMEFKLIQYTYELRR